MNGELAPEQQLRVLSKVWGNDRDGYVFLPYIDGQARTVERRRKSYHEGRAYEWPKDRGAILDHLKSHGGDDVYFTPALFNAKRRTEQNVDAERTLWADLDPVEPQTLGTLRPTIAWETSPGRYQAVWILDRPRVGASWASKENHRLSLHIGADPSGWDSTQLLRVPGRANHKPVYGDQPVSGRLLWDNGPRYVWEDFVDLPEVGSLPGEDIDFFDEELLGSVDRYKLWSTIRLKVSKRCREYMGSRSADGTDRSEVLWQIERELADAGCSVLEIVALVRPTVWNKYAGRADELKRLKSEAAKAIAAREEAPIESDDEVVKPKIQWLNSFVHTPIARPRWLVEGLWTQGGCGFISGQPKSYKSWLAIDLAVSVATGTAFLGLADHKARRPRPVLYIQEEDDLRLVMSRLANVVEAKAPDLYWHGQLSAARTEAQGADPGGYTGQGLPPSVRAVWRPPAAPIPLAVHVQGGFVVSDAGWQAWLTETVAEGKFALVIIDTLGTTAGEVDTDRSGDLMGKILKPLKAVAQMHDTAICLVHHNRKTSADQKGGRAGQDMLGSVALHAWVDCAIYARAREGGELLLEREAKQASELSLKIRIPQMTENHVTGQRQLWAPEQVITEGPDQAPPATEAKQAAGRPTRASGAVKAKLGQIGLKPGSTVPASRVDGVLTRPEIDRLLKSGELTFNGETETYTRRA